MHTGCNTNLLCLRAVWAPLSIPLLHLSHLTASWGLREGISDPWFPEECLLKYYKRVVANQELTLPTTYCLGPVKRFKYSTALLTPTRTAAGCLSRLFASNISRSGGLASCRGALVEESFSACTARESEGVDKSS